MMPRSYLTNYGREKNGVLEGKPQTWGHQGSWAYTREVFDRIGGFTTEEKLNGDTDMQSALRQQGEPGRYGDPCRPSYVYRWNSGSFNISQRGRDGFGELWHRTGMMPAPHVGLLVPKLDQESELIFTRYVDGDNHACRNSPSDSPPAMNTPALG